MTPNAQDNSNPGFPRLLNALAWGSCLGALSGLLLSVIDSAVMLRHADPSFGIKFRALAHHTAACLVLGAGLGMALSLLCTSALGLKSRVGGRIYASVLLIAVAGPAFLVSRIALSGSGISRHDSIEALRFLAPLVLMIVAAAALAVQLAAMRTLWRATQWRWASMLAGASGLFILAGCVWIDSSWLRTKSYEWFHNLLFPVSFVGAWWLVNGLSGVGKRRLRAPLLLGMALLLGASGTSLFCAAPSEASRYALNRKSLWGRELLMIHDFFRPVEESVEALRLAGGGRARGERLVLARRESASEEAFQTRQKLLRRKLGSQRPWNVLWITVDTLRGDHVGHLGYQKDTTPHLDALAAKGCTLRSHWAQNPLTHDSFQSMFYGLYPGATPLRSLIEKKFGYRAVRERVAKEPTFAARLSREGWRTAAAPAMPPASRKTTKYRIFERGFETLDPGDGGPKREAEHQFERAMSWLQKAPQKPWFFWLHLFDPHAPYYKHKEFDFGSGSAQRYDSEVAHVDHYIGKLLEWVASSPEADRTIIVFNADHGEALGDHGTDYHGSTLYEEQVHVPAIIFVPGLAPQSIATPTENVDIYPTLLDLLGLRPEQGVQGRSILPLLLAGDAAAEAGLDLAYAELPGSAELSADARSRYALRDGRYKILASISEKGVLSNRELYDLREDPRELRNLAFDQPERASELAWLLKLMWDETQARAEEASKYGEAQATRPKDVADASKRLAQVRESSLNLRHDVIRQLVLAKDPVVAELARLRFADSDCHWTEKVALIALATKQAGALMTSHIAELLVPAMPWAARAAGLQALCLLPSAQKAEFVAAHEMLIREILLGPRPVARLAARALCASAIRDARALSLLREDMAGPDPMAGYEAAISLAGDGLSTADIAICEAVLQRGVYASLRTPKHCVRGLAALGQLPRRCSIAFLTDLLSDRYLFASIKLEAMERLKEHTDPEIAAAAWFQLLKGWDPTITQRCWSALDDLVGEARRKNWQSAARLLASARELNDQGLLDESAQELRQAIALCGTDGASLLPKLELLRHNWVWRRSHGGGAPSQKTLDLAKSMTSVRGIPEAFVSEINALLIPQVLSETPSLIAEQLTPHFKEIPTQGRDVVGIVRVMNVGTTPVFGGQWVGAPKFVIAWESNGQRQESVPSPAHLPIGGCAPGESVSFVVRGKLPASSGCMRFFVEPSFEGARGLQWAREDAAVSCTMPIGAIGPAEGLMPGESLRLEGHDFLRVFRASPSSIDSVQEADGTVSIIPTLYDPWWLTTDLQSQRGRLEAQIEYAVRDGAEADPTSLAVFWMMSRAEGPTALRSRSMQTPADGKMKQLKAVIPSEGPTTPTGLRIDLVHTPHVIRFKALTLKRLP